MGGLLLRPSAYAVASFNLAVQLIVRVMDLIPSWKVSAINSSKGRNSENRIHAALLGCAACRFTSRVQKALVKREIATERPVSMWAR